MLIVYICSITWYVYNIINIFVLYLLDKMVHVQIIIYTVLLILYDFYNILIESAS